MSPLWASSILQGRGDIGAINNTAAASPFSRSLQRGEAIPWIKGVTKHSAAPARVCVWLWLSKRGGQRVFYPPADSPGPPRLPPAHGVTCSGAGAAAGSVQSKALGTAALSSELLCRAVQEGGAAPPAAPLSFVVFITPPIQIPLLLPIPTSIPIPISIPIPTSTQIPLHIPASIPLLILILIPISTQIPTPQSQSESQSQSQSIPIRFFRSGQNKQTK